MKHAAAHYWQTKPMAGPLTYFSTSRRRRRRNRYYVPPPRPQLSTTNGSSTRYNAEFAVSRKQQQQSSGLRVRAQGRDNTAGQTALSYGDLTPRELRLPGACRTQRIVIYPLLLIRCSVRHRTRHNRCQTPNIRMARRTLRMFC